MRKALVVTFGAAILMLGVGPALADGPTGSTENKPCPATSAERDAALADEPGSESCTYDEFGDPAEPGQTYESNDVTCGYDASDPGGSTGYNVTGIVVEGDADGIEACSESGPLGVIAGDLHPVVPGAQGRVTVDFNDQFVAVDGDRDNPDGGLTGWARADADGVSCSKDGGTTDAANKSDETVDDCHPAATP
jgi:hypothetical protein